MNIIFSKTVSVIASFFLGMSMMFGYTPPAQQDNLGATFDIPTVVSSWETSLSSAITSSATSMTLVSGLMKNGSNLASSTYGFVIDSGKAEEEFVLADCSNITCTNMTRGIDPVSGTTTVVSLQFAHRRGASVKITDGPQLLILSRIMNGIGTLPNKISYKAGTACSVSDGNQTICDKAYIDGVGSSGASNANETTKGIIELSTASEARLGTSLGSTGARLVIPNDMATSSNDVAQTHLVVTQNNGKIHQGFLDLTQAFSFSGVNTFSGLSTLSGLISTASTTFVATTTLAGSSLTNNAIVINGLPYQFPSVRCTGGQALIDTTGTGIMVCRNVGQRSYADSTGATGSNGVATTSVFTIPANVMNASSTINIRAGIIGSQSGAGNTCIFDIVQSPSGSSIISSGSITIPGAAGSPYTGMLDAQIIPTSSTGQINHLQAIVVTAVDTAAGGYSVAEGTSAITVASGLSVAIKVTGGVNASCSVANWNMVVSY